MLGFTLLYEFFLLFTKQVSWALLFSMNSYISVVYPASLLGLTLLYEFLHFCCLPSKSPGLYSFLWIITFLLFTQQVSWALLFSMNYYISVVYPASLLGFTLFYELLHFCCLPSKSPGLNSSLWILTFLLFTQQVSWALLFSMNSYISVVYPASLLGFTLFYELLHFCCLPSKSPGLNSSLWILTFLLFTLQVSWALLFSMNSYISVVYPASLLGLTLLYEFLHFCCLPSKSPGLYSSLWILTFLLFTQQVSWALLFSMNSYISVVYPASLLGLTCTGLLQQEVLNPCWVILSIFLQ